MTLYRATTDENPRELVRVSHPHPGPPPNVGEGKVGGIFLTAEVWGL